MSDRTITLITSDVQYMKPIQQRVKANESVAVGDWYLKCPACDYSLPRNTAANPLCPDCNTRMRVITVCAIA